MMKENQFDTIVIGAGMSGGWAAKEFCEQGFNTLLIERGRNVEHIKDYPTTNMLPWEFKFRGDVPAKVREEKSPLPLVVMPLEKTPCIFLLRTMNTPMYKLSLFSGFVAIR